jgi:hypothetical protein
MGCVTHRAVLAFVTAMAIIVPAHANDRLDSRAANLIDDVLEASRTAPDLVGWHASGKTSHDAIGALNGKPKL